MKFTNVKRVVSGRGVTLEVHRDAAVFDMLEGAEFEALVEDMRAHGVRVPIVVQGDKLIDGRNRLRACQKLGIDPPVTILDDKVDVRAYIISANLHRRHLNESQRAYAAAQLATMEMGANQHGQGRVRKFANPPSQADAAKLMGVSPRSVSDARKVIDRGDADLNAAVKSGKIKVSAAAQVAELGKVEQRALVEKVTTGGGEVKPGKVAALARQQGKRDVVERINKGLVRPLPIGPFRVLVADYPWPYENSDGHEGSRGHIEYPPMSLADIARHARDDLGKAADDDAILGLWVTNAFVPVVGKIVEAAGFTWRTMITWDKGRPGVGTWPRGQTEHLVIASKGGPVHTLNEITTLYREPPREPGRKPDGLMDLLRKHCPGPHLELFARQEREGWSSWGAEVGKFAATLAATAPPAAEERDPDAEWGPASSAASEASPLDEQLAEPWTCGECGHVNTFRILDGILEVCGNCEVPRPRPAPSLAPQEEDGDDVGFEFDPWRANPVEPTPASALEQLAEPEPAIERFEPWTCRARPAGGECGHVNTFRAVSLVLKAEVCASCGCARPGHGSPGKPAKVKPAKAVKPGKPAKEVKPTKHLSVPPSAPDAPFLKPRDMILLRWPPGTKRARFVRYTRKGDMVVNVQKVDRRGVYLKGFGSDRTFAITDYAGRAS